MRCCGRSARVEYAREWNERSSGIKNHRGELQRVLSREESYVDGKLSRAAFISIAILTFITFVGNFTQLQLSSALPIIVSEFHISVTTGQWLTSVFQLVMGVMVPLTAFLTRRFSTRQIVICSMAVFTLGSVLAWLGPNFVWVLVGRVLEAAGTGVMWPVLQITVFSIYPLSRRGFAMGTVGMAMSVAPAIGPTLGGWQTDANGWRSIFLTMTIIGVISLLAAMFGLHNFGSRPFGPRGLLLGMPVGDRLWRAYVRLHQFRDLWIRGTGHVGTYGCGSDRHRMVRAA